MSQVAAFFDMDLTLIRVNSARLWVQYLWREGRLAKRDLVRSAMGLVGYKLAVVDMERLARDAVARLAGELESQMHEQVSPWYESIIRPTICEMMRATLEHHREQGHHAVLLTASSTYIAAPLARDLAFEHVIASRFEVADGRFTGNVVDPLCYGAGKVLHAEAWAREHDVDLEACWFYTDSYTDLPMIRRVGHPVVVNPDPRLLRWARQNSVKILQAS